MQNDQRTLTVPLPVGKTTTLFELTSAPAGTREVTFPIDSDSILLSLWVGSIASGTLTVTAYTQTRETHEREIIFFPVITGPTTELLLEKAALAMSVVRVVVTTTDTCSFDIRAKGITAGETSVKITGANNWTVSQTDIPTIPTLVIPVSLTDRNGLVLKNYSLAATLFIAETAVKATSAVGYPIGPGESLAFDLEGGQEIWGAASAGTIDVRISEAGG